MINEIKNTLFRFVSIQSPELVADANQKPSFVFQDENDKGIFNTATNNIAAGTSKQAVLKSTATNFEANAKSADALKSLNVKLYEFSVWLAKNRYSASESEISSKAKSVSSTSLDLKLIWENLFYQVITQKDFYAKEVTMQLLLAYHVTVSTNGTYKERALAKVVLPKEVFIEDKSTNQAATQNKVALRSTEVPFASYTMQKLENKSIAEDNNKVLQKLKTELAQVEVLHKKKYEIHGK